MEDVRYDDQHCQQYSLVEGPWLFGLGALFTREVARQRYTECMEIRGYVAVK